MVTISLCMIVKNEEKVLARCLDSIYDLMDEIIIVDTGSVDKTKKIAARYTDKIYDFEWICDFSAARNFAFSKANCDYIYSADADEVLNPENREKFKTLKEVLMPEVEIVQMYYGNQLFSGTVYNFDKELRPKLFKRLRSFQWIEPVHETVRLLPVVFDSDIEITHLPENVHTGRDLAIFKGLIERGEGLSERLFDFYARELFVSGSAEDFAQAEAYFTEVSDNENTSMEQMKTAVCIVVKAAALRGDYLKMYRYAMKDIASEGVSEVCFELGEYYFGQKEYKEAILWFYNAAYQTECILNIHYRGEKPLYRLADCYEALGMPEEAAEYRITGDEWIARQDVI